MSATAPAPRPAPQQQTAARPAPGQQSASQAVTKRLGASYLATSKTGLQRATSNRSTPTLLRIMLAVSATFAVIFGLTTSLVMGTANGAISAGASDTQQLLRVQNIQANLYRADATATNSFLIGGMETPEQAATFQRSLDDAQIQMVEAAAAQPHDREALQELSRQIGHYRSTMQDARSANRQGLPVGTAYLNDATQKLRSDAMPIVDNLVQSNDARVKQQTRPVGWGLVLFTGLLSLACLMVTMTLTALRFRRILNPGLALATALVLVGLITAMSLTSNTNSDLRSVRENSLATARYTSISRVQAYDAKANESLSLISRSRSGSYESAWNRASWLNRKAIRKLPSYTQREELSGLWTNHVLSHRKIRDLDSDGLWNDARAVATGGGEMSSTSTFNAFDEMVTSVSESAGSEAVQLLNKTRPAMMGGVIVALLTTIGALVAATWGINSRLKEYA